MPRCANEVASPNERKNLPMFAVSNAVSTWSLIRPSRSISVMPACAASAWPCGDSITVTADCACATTGNASSMTRIGARRMPAIVHQATATPRRRAPDCDGSHALKSSGGVRWTGLEQRLARAVRARLTHVREAEFIDEEPRTCATLPLHRAVIEQRLRVRVVHERGQARLKP